VYFYELHEADDELAIGMTLAHDEAFAPSEFLAMVETARSRVMETFTEETLIEAIAAELEREHDFAASLDSRLVAAVGVSSEEGETRLLTHEGAGATPLTKVRRRIPTWPSPRRCSQGASRSACEPQW